MNLTVINLVVIVSITSPAFFKELWSYSPPRMDQSVELLFLKHSFSSLIKNSLWESAKRDMQGENGLLRPGPSQGQGCWKKSSRAGFSPCLCWRRRQAKLFCNGREVWSHYCQGAELETPTPGLWRCRRGGWKVALLLLPRGTISQQDTRYLCRVQLLSLSTTLLLTGMRMVLLWPEGAQQK